MSGNKIHETRRMLWEVSGFTLEKVKRRNGAPIPSKVCKIIVDGKITELEFLIYPKYGTNTVAVVLLMRVNKTELSDFGFETTFNCGISSTKMDYSFEGPTKSPQKLNDLWTLVGTISHEKIFNPDNKYLIKGKLTIFCEVSISTTSGRNGALANICEVSGFAKCFLREMFLKEEVKDSELHTSDGKVLKCHKFILAAQSSVFEAMFMNELDETRKGIVKIQDFDSETMQQLLRFVYCLEVEGMDEIAHVLIYAADKYMIKQLKELCLKSLMMSLKQENALQTLIIADQVSDATKLFSECLKVIARNYQVLSETSEWKSLPRPTMQKIIHHIMPRFNADHIFSASSL